MRFRRSTLPPVSWVLALGLVALAGCGAGSEDTAVPAAEEKAPPQQPHAAGPIGQLAASHILIEYAGAPRAEPNITRSREEALELASELARKAKAGEDFAELARTHSDGPTAQNGGNLGLFPVAQMIPAFSAACAKLEIGEVSEPVETEFGFHVIRRNPVIAARHILVMHDGSRNKPPEVHRPREEARALSEKVLAEARQGGDFKELARKYSDDKQSGPSGGELGFFARGAMVPAFDQAAFALEVGGVSEVVETDFGFHIIQRFE